jgi:hypothetical protein
MSGDPLAQFPGEPSLWSIAAQLIAFDRKSNIESFQLGKQQFGAHNIIRSHLPVMPRGGLTTRRLDIDGRLQ